VSNLELLIIVIVVGATFGYLWRKGHVARLSTYLAETREELRKCTWPTKEELKGSTVVVLIATLLLGGFIICTDFVVLEFVRKILPRL
jgi:preprotein translocase subunit SecE